ncbi:hypothetical protein N7450_008862, partial [Penicillium hetheringtonii]
FARMAVNYSNPDSLAELSTLVERTLLDTGRLFRKNGTISSSTHMQRSIPSYYESFQVALDNLSEQIFIAKAFLEKDYEAIRAREAAPQPAEDVAMNDVDQNTTATQVQPSPPQIQPQSQPEPVEKAPSPEKVDLKKEEPSATEPQAGTTTDPQPSEEAPVKEEVENDPGWWGNSFDLNLDFGNDDMGNQAFLSGSTFGGPLPDTEKPNASNPAETSIPTPSGGGDRGDEMMGPGESNFDDLFMETENFGESGDLNHLEGDSLMNISELDDNWFS